MIRVAVTGPESTGKTMLCAQLSNHFGCPVVAEYARTYLEKLNRPYTFEEVEMIALTQLKQESEILNTNPDLLIADTELLVIKIWMQHKFNKIPPWLEMKLAEQEYDLYLLCNADIAWEYDPLRENPGAGKYFFDLYLNELKNRNYNYIVISGNYQQRFDSAVEKIMKIINSRIDKK